MVRWARAGRNLRGAKEPYDTNGIKSGLLAVSKVHSARPTQSEEMFLLWGCVSLSSKGATQARRPKRQSASCEETVKRAAGERGRGSKKNAARICGDNLTIMAKNGEKVKRAKKLCRDAYLRLDELRQKV